MKIRTDFVTNSSSANYSVTLKVDCDGGEHAEIMIHTYDFEPWYEDTEDGCATYDRQAHALSYDVDDLAGAQSAESVRELCDILLSAVHEYGWGIEKHISTFGDSTRLLGFYDSDRGTKVTYSDEYVDWESWGDDEGVNWTYRRY